MASAAEAVGKFLVLPDHRVVALDRIRAIVPQPESIALLVADSEGLVSIPVSTDEEQAETIEMITKAVTRETNASLATLTGFYVRRDSIVSFCHTGVLTSPDGVKHRIMFTIDCGTSTGKMERALWLPGDRENIDALMRGIAAELSPAPRRRFWQRRNR